jgi:hypothetical protein
MNGSFAAVNVRKRLRTQPKRLRVSGHSQGCFSVERAKAADSDETCRISHGRHVNLLLTGNRYTLCE